MTTREGLKRQGNDMRRRLFGDDRLQGAADGSPDLLRTVDTEATYGAIWSRPGLALGEELVVETVDMEAGYLDTLGFPGLPESAQMRTDERFIANGDRLQVIVTHNDKLSAQSDRIIHMQDGQIV